MPYLVAPFQPLHSISCLDKSARKSLCNIAGLNQYYDDHNMVAENMTSSKTQPDPRFSPRRVNDNELEMMWPTTQRFRQPNDVAEGSGTSTRTSCQLFGSVILVKIYFLGFQIYDFYILSQKFWILLSLVVGEDSIGSKISNHPD